jgi:mono/diheme cytochrome c family protein
VSFWTDGKGDDRVIYVTTGYRMISLRAKDGSMIPSFGKGGVVDLKEGVVYGSGKQIDLETGEIGLHSTPLVVKDTVIVGSAMKEGFTPKTHNNTKGLVRAFDVRTGKQLWPFNTIPKPGEFGGDTWENESWAVNGNTGVWTQMTVDEELGIVYLPVETPTNDFYGGHRPGNNLFGESLVRLDLKTGKRIWHFQFVHHAIWDHDMSSAPILADITVDGKKIKAVAVPSKQSWLYVFDRVTGKPVWPIEERPVPQSDVPGEKTSPTQPFVTKPPAYARTFMHVPDDVIDFTPELRKEGLENLKRYKWVNSPYVPLIAGDVNGLLGTINLGNTSGGNQLARRRLRSRDQHLLYAGQQLVLDHRLAGGAARRLLRHPLPRGGEGPRVPRGRGPGLRRRCRRAAAPRAAASRGRRRCGPACVPWHRAAGPADHQAALRGGVGDPARQGRAAVAGPARRHARHDPQPPAAEGHEHPEDRPDRQRRRARHEDAGDRGRPAGHDHARASARRDDARVRQGERQGGRRGADADAHQRLADDLQRRRQAVHRDRRERRRVFGRVHRVRAADRGERDAQLAGGPLPVRPALAAASVFLAAMAAVARPAQEPETTRTVWDGVYNEAQSKRGLGLYGEHCARCHSENLGGGESATALVGDSFESGWNGLSVGDLSERIRISMPQDKPGSLSRQQVADVLAYIFEVNKFPKGEKELDRQLQVLKTIKLVMPKPSP